MIQKIQVLFQRKIKKCIKIVYNIKMDNHKNKYQLMSNKKVNQYLMNKVNRKCQKMKYNNKLK